MTTPPKPSLKERAPDCQRPQGLNYFSLFLFYYILIRMSNQIIMSIEDLTNRKHVLIDTSSEGIELSQ
jgi:hypothetical protein